MKKTKLFCGIMGWAVAAVLPVEVAQAQISSYSIGSDGLESFNLSITSGLVTADYNNALAGGIALNYVSGPGMGSFASVCTDISATLWLGGTYTYNAPIGFAGATGLTPAWGAFVGGVANSANESAAIQAAADIFYKYGSILSANSVSGGMTGSVTDERAGLQLAIWTALYNTSVTAGSASILSSFNASSGGRFQVLGLGTESWSGSWGSSSLGTSAADRRPEHAEISQFWRSILWQSLGAESDHSKWRLRSHL
jgi:hypothetical protein